MAEALGLAILLIAGVNLFLYVAAALAFGWAFRLRRTNRAFAVALLLVGAFPFLHYSVQVARAQFEPARRAEEIRAWTTAPHATEDPPRSIELVNAFHNDEVSALVAAGVLDEVQVALENWPYGSFAFALAEGAECIDFADSGSPRAEFRRVVLARHAFQRCVQRVQRNAPADAPLRMYFGRGAPSRYRGPGCLGGGDRATLELRWSASRGGKLFAFWEPPDFIPLAFPPRWMGDGRIWACAMLHPDDQTYWFPDPFRFTASALGFNTPNDFPRSSDPGAPARALRLLRAELQAAYAQDRILALLGQWPPSQQIRDEFKDASQWSRSDRWLADAVSLLSEPGEVGRRQELYPHLSSHQPMLVDFCRRLMGPLERGGIPAACWKLVPAAKAEPAPGG